MWSGWPRCTGRRSGRWRRPGGGVRGFPCGGRGGLAAMYGAAKRSLIRLGWGMTRFTYGGQALRTVALLPGVTGAYGRYGGGALNGTNASFELNYNAVRKPSGPAETRTINPNRMGGAAAALRNTRTP